MNPTQQRTVVIIEDDVDLRGLVATVLSNAGLRVETTGDSPHAVDFVRREQPDLILCDIAMPEMDGYAVVRALQADPATRHYPVVFLTARREFTDRVRAFRFGVVDYITKPVSSETLLSRVDSILAGLKDRPAQVQGEAPILVQGARRDHPTEDIVVHDPSRTTAPLPLPDFSEIPAALRDIVIADDHAPFRTTIAEVFTECGFQVREAGDGLEAVRRVLENPPSLLLVDVRMPVLDGFEVCRRLRSHALTRHLPIVFLSGFDEFEARAEGLEAGANEFLSKLTSLRELLLRVQLQLRRYVLPARGGETTRHGHIELLGGPSALHVCRLTAATGTLAASDGSRTIMMGFEEGRLLSADSAAAGGREAVFEFLEWERGTFVFTDGTPYAGTPITEQVTALVSEGCRRIDERNRQHAPLDASGAADR